MAALVRFDAKGSWGKTLLDARAVGDALRSLGLSYGRWPRRAVGDGSLDAVLAAYGPELDSLKSQLSIRHVDRVTVKPGNPDWPVLRHRFLAEHTHADAEIRYFLGGSGLFYIRCSDGHLALLCEAGEWIVVPAGMPHFFDAGEHPDFDALRLFSIPQGWEADFTGSRTSRLPTFDKFRVRLNELLAAEAGAASSP
ncbi:MAG: AraC family ligand binding domain-containing protein [Dechloromonas sp.]|nr:AraC family ligand binding domain-containing protein [Dechloromonas sp.]